MVFGFSKKKQPDAKQPDANAAAVASAATPSSSSRNSVSRASTTSIGGTSRKRAPLPGLSAKETDVVLAWATGKGLGDPDAEELVRRVASWAARQCYPVAEGIIDMEARLDSIQGDMCRRQSETNQKLARLHDTSLRFALEDAGRESLSSELICVQQSHGYVVRILDGLINQDLRPAELENVNAASLSKAATSSLSEVITQLQRLQGNNKKVDPTLAKDPYRQMLKRLEESIDALRRNVFDLVERHEVAVDEMKRVCAKANSVQKALHGNAQLQDLMKRFDTAFKGGAVDEKQFGETDTQTAARILSDHTDHIKGISQEANTDLERLHDSLSRQTQKIAKLLEPLALLLDETATPELTPRSMSQKSTARSAKSDGKPKIFGPGISWGFTNYGANRIPLDGLNDDFSRKENESIPYSEGFNGFNSLGKGSGKGSESGQLGTSLAISKRRSPDVDSNLQYTPSGHTPAGHSPRGHAAGTGLAEELSRIPEEAVWEARHREREQKGKESLLKALSNLDAVPPNVQAIENAAGATASESASAAAPNTSSALAYAPPAASSGGGYAAVPHDRAIAPVASSAGSVPHAAPAATAAAAPLPSFFGRANVRSGPSASQAEAQHARDAAGLTPRFLSGLEGAEGVSVRDSVEKQMWTENWKEQSGRIGNHRLGEHTPTQSQHMPTDPTTGDSRELEQLLRVLRGLEGAGPEAQAAAERQLLEQGLTGRRNEPGRRTPQSPGSAGSFLRERAKETTEMRAQIQDIMKQNSRIFKVLERHGVFKGKKGASKLDSDRRRKSTEIEEKSRIAAACDGCQTCW